MTDPARGSDGSTDPTTSCALTLREIIFDAVLDALDRNGGNQSQAARELGIGRSTLFRWMREMNKGPFKQGK